MSIWSKLFGTKSTASQANAGIGAKPAQTASSSDPLSPQEERAFQGISSLFESSLDRMAASVSNPAQSQRVAQSFKALRTIFYVEKNTIAKRAVACWTRAVVHSEVFHHYELTLGVAMSFVPGGTDAVRDRLNQAARNPGRGYTDLFVHLMNQFDLHRCDYFAHVVFLFDAPRDEIALNFCILPLHLQKFDPSGFKFMPLDLMTPDEKRDFKF